MLPVATDRLAGQRCEQKLRQLRLRRLSILDEDVVRILRLRLHPRREVGAGELATGEAVVAHGPARPGHRGVLASPGADATRGATPPSTPSGAPRDWDRIILFTLPVCLSEPALMRAIPYKKSSPVS